VSQLLLHRVSLPAGQIDGTAEWTVMAIESGTVEGWRSRRQEGQTAENIYFRLVGTVNSQRFSELD
jgi:hypothetical protein